MPHFAILLLSSVLTSFTLACAQTSRDPSALFAASCATCHGDAGLGGSPSWVVPARMAPRIARGFAMPNPMLEARFRFTIRNGSYYGPGFMPAMPAFGPDVITDAELNLLVPWLIYAPPVGGADPVNGVPPPPTPVGRGIVLEILDEAPWFRDDGTDLADPFGDRRRVVLSPGDYIKVVNRGRTWHTVSNPGLGVDTGLIGFSGNLPAQSTGYSYLTIAGLAPGAHKYWCSMHPYMQVEVVTPGTTPTALTRVQRLAQPLPQVRGCGEVWVGLQTWANPAGPHGAVEVIAASTWATTLIPGVGNNPHNGWIGTARDTNGQERKIVVFANWHDASVTILDARQKTVLGSVRVGAANAHVMTAPPPVQRGGGDRWYVTVMGSNKVHELDPFPDLLAGTATLPALSQSDGISGHPAYSPHGLWFLDSGAYFVTANTYPGSASLHALRRPWSDASGHAGIGCEVASASSGGASPLAASVFGPVAGGQNRFVAYTNNAGTDDISVYEIDASPGAETDDATRRAAAARQRCGQPRLDRHDGEPRALGAHADPVCREPARRHAPPAVHGRVQQDVDERQHRGARRQGHADRRLHVPGGARLPRRDVRSQAPGRRPRGAQLSRIRDQHVPGLRQRLRPRRAGEDAAPRGETADPCHRHSGRVVPPSSSRSPVTHRRCCSACRRSWCRSRCSVPTRADSCTSATSR
jgi:cytochrome c5